MAVWCALLNNSTRSNEPQLEAHFNYWRVADSKKKRNDFLEVGLMLTHSHHIDKICIFVPIKINRKKVSDCGKYFSDANIAQGIFNEILIPTILPPGEIKAIELQTQSRTQFCRVHKFLENNDSIDSSELNVESLDSGTLITIKKSVLDSVNKNLADGSKSYIRLRIEMPDSEGSPFIRKITPADNFLQSGYEEVEYIDFRVNEARTLPDPVEAMIRTDGSNGTLKFKYLAFLTAIPVLAELTVSNSMSHKNRLLEKEPWNSYVPLGIPSGMMVYHWKKVDQNNGFDDFSAFVKLQTRRSNKWTIFTYLIIAFFFGVFGNLLASCIDRSINLDKVEEVPPPIINTEDATKEDLTRENPIKSDDVQ